jgi:hypothetical protein
MVMILGEARIEPGGSLKRRLCLRESPGNSPVEGRSAVIDPLPQKIPD